jgi:hypothetical protein
MEYSRNSPSEQYRNLIAQHAHMHAEGYAVAGPDSGGVGAQHAYPGNELPKFIGPIKALIIKHGAGSILDYGSGKGLQYAPITVKDEHNQTYPDIKSYWGVREVVCYDPAIPGLSTVPNRRFDGVVSTDVLEHCPADDIPWIVREMFSLARNFIFANIACYPARATLPTGENAHSTVRHPQWWAGLFKGIGNEFETVEYHLSLVSLEDQPDGSQRPLYFAVHREA